MDSNVTTTQADISRLTDKDKAELAQFITNEQQRTRIQSRESLLLRRSPYFPAFLGIRG